MNQPSFNYRRLSSNGRRRLFIICAAVTTFIAADLVVRRLRPKLQEFNVGEYDRRPKELQQRAMPDIVLLGSSRAKYAFVPEIFESVTGRPAYNCGIAGSKVVEWLALTRRLFADEQPRLVVLGINASEVRSDYLPSEAARNFFDWHELIESCEIEGFQPEVIGGYLRKTVLPGWALLDQRYGLKMWGQEQLAWVLPKYAQQSRELRIRAARPNPPNGYYHPWAVGRQLQNLDVRLMENVASVESASVPAFTPDSPTYTRLGQLLQMFHDRGIETLVAYVPNSPRTEQRWRQVEPLMIERISEVCRDHGTPFLSCNADEVTRDNTDYMEEIHMGYPLAQRISRRVANRIVQLGLLSNTRTRLAQHESRDDLSHDGL